MKTNLKYLIFFLISAPLYSQAQVVLPPCIPGITGKSAAFIPQYKEGTVANHLYWKCIDPKDTTKELIYGLSCLKSTCSREKFAETIKTVSNSTAKVATAKRLYKELVTKDCTSQTELENTPFGVMCLERKTLLPE